MDRALALSFIFHLLLFAPFFIPWGEKGTPENTTIIDLRYIGPGKEKAPPKRVKKLKKQPKVNNKKSKWATETSDEEKEGNDTKDFNMKEGGGLNDPALMAVAAYARDLQDFIERNRYYPRKAQVMKQTGTVTVRLTINPDGSFATIEIIEGTKHKILNHAAKDLVTELKAFKPLPDSYRGDGIFIVPIDYQIRAGQF